MKEPAKTFSASADLPVAREDLVVWQKAHLAF